MSEIVATTSLPVDRLTATDCNAAAHANIALDDLHQEAHICARGRDQEADGFVFTSVEGQ